MHTILCVDGVSRGNPGPSGCGFVLADDSGAIIASGGWFMAAATTNIAVYSALIWGLRNAVAAGSESVEAYCDSQLLASQMNGTMKAMSVDLRPLHREARNLISGLSAFTLDLVRRADNKQAAHMAEEALYKRGPVGTYRIGMETGQESLFRVRADGQEDLKKAAPSSYGDAFLQKEGDYELTVKTRFKLVRSSSEDEDGDKGNDAGEAVNVSVRVIGSTLDREGRLYGFDDLRYRLETVVAAIDGRAIGEVSPFDRIPATMENVARVLYWELDKLMPDKLFLAELGIWSNAAGAKVAYRGRKGRERTAG